MQPEYLAGHPYAPPVQTLAGRYRLSARLLGRGGLADVWAGVDEMLDRPVAVKIFRPGSEPADEQRFAREVHTLTGLSHPHLISLYDAGEAEGRAYLVMGQVSGGTLSASLHAQGSLPAETVRRMGAQVASALAYIHSRGIVHRDVKPANILLDDSEAAVLADFGIARLIDGTQLTSTGLTVGTAAYLSPEQVRGRQVGPPADVYALGLVLLEALTGRREYPGEPVEAAVARLYRTPEVPENLPYGLTGLLHAMTADEPGLRPSAKTVYDMLGRAVAAVPSQIRAVAGMSSADPTRPLLIPVRRRRRRALWLAPVGIMIGATAAGISLNAQSAPDAADASTPTRTAPATAGHPSASGAPTKSAAAVPGHPSNIAATPAAPFPSVTAASVAQRATNVASVSKPRPADPPAPPAGNPGQGKGRGAGHGHGHGKGGSHDGHH